MSLMTKACAVIFCLLGLACGPEKHESEDWMLGIFSESGRPGLSVSSESLGKFRFEGGGIAHSTNLSSCGEQGETWGTQYEWERREGSTIAIVQEPAHEDATPREWHFTPSGCNEFGWESVRWEEVVDGDVVVTFQLRRGDMCLERFDCNGDNDELQCADCRTVWCDEPPPPCSPD